MGKNTYNSSDAFPLECRLNIVLRRKKKRTEWIYHPEITELAYNWKDALELSKLLMKGYEKVFVIGGQRVYKEAIKKVDDMYITHVRTTIEDGDRFFPKFDKKEWDIVSS